MAKFDIKMHYEIDEDKLNFENTTDCREIRRQFDQNLKHTLDVDTDNPKYEKMFKHQMSSLYSNFSSEIFTIVTGIDPGEPFSLEMIGAAALSLFVRCNTNNGDAHFNIFTLEHGLQNRLFNDAKFYDLCEALCTRFTEIAIEQATEHN